MITNPHRSKSSMVILGGLAFELDSVFGAGIFSNLTRQRLVTLRGGSENGEHRIGRLKSSPDVEGFHVHWKDT